MIIILIQQCILHSINNEGSFREMKEKISGLGLLILIATFIICNYDISSCKAATIVELNEEYGLTDIVDRYNDYFSDDYSDMILSRYFEETPDKNPIPYTTQYGSLSIFDVLTVAQVNGNGNVVTISVNIPNSHSLSEVYDASVALMRAVNPYWEDDENSQYNTSSNSINGACNRACNRIGTCQGYKSISKQRYYCVSIDNTASGYLIVVGAVLV